MELVRGEEALAFNNVLFAKVSDDAHTGCPHAATRERKASCES
jgi:hypothetical protein